MADPIYVTTPIYYVNDRPHIGHVYTSTLCDVFTRFQRLAGRDAFFLTGTDEHGVKVEKSATERGISPQELADENAAEFRKIMGMFNLTNDDFIRTTSDAHVRQVKTFVRRLQESGAVYSGEFEGWYDEGQEEYYTETKARELDYASPITKKPLIRATETNYYFRLSAFQERLEAVFESQPDFVKPPARRNEVLGRLREGLQDVPMSRTNFSWGITMPDDPDHVIYVWIEALMNYVTGLGLLDPGSDHHSARHQYWPATYQVIGKEILWFHAVVWPALLMAIDLPIPKCVYAHSFWISEGQKMSKTLGNFIDLEALQSYIETYSLDVLRYYLVTQGPLGATDADFSANHFHETYTTDLVNTFGNSASRVTAMINKYFDGVVPADPGIEVAEHDWPSISATSARRAREAFDRFDLAGGIAVAMDLIRTVDAFINLTEPFKLAKDETKRDELAAILYRCIEAVRIASVLLWAVCPAKMETFWSAISQTDTLTHTMDELVAWGGLKPSTLVEKVALFPRVEAAAAGSA